MANKAATASFKLLSGGKIVLSSSIRVTSSSRSCLHAQTQVIHIHGLDIDGTDQYRTWHPFPYARNKPPFRC